MKKIILNPILIFQQKSVSSSTTFKLDEMHNEWSLKIAKRWILIWWMQTSILHTKPSMKIFKILFPPLVINFPLVWLIFNIHVCLVIDSAAQLKMASREISLAFCIVRWPTIIIAIVNYWCDILHRPVID
jgi:hypothetical protein